MKHHVLWLAGVMLGINGCATTQDFRPLFNEKEFAWSAGDGTATLRGQAFARTLGGEVRYCAGVEVYLVPETTYTKAVAQAILQGHQKFSDYPEGYRKYRRTTLGDGTGSFEFTKVPAGAWYVGCNLVWYVPGNWGMQATGALLERRVELRDGESLKVVVTSDTLSAGAEAAPEKPKKVCTNALWC